MLCQLLINQVDNLLYRQICLLKLFVEDHSLLRSSNYRNNQISKKLVPILYEIIDLDKKQLINNSEHHVFGLTDLVPKEYVVHGLGKLLYELMELNNMPDSEIIELKEILSI